jgi:sialic acid synthase SpsE
MRQVPCFTRGRQPRYPGSMLMTSDEFSARLTEATPAFVIAEGADAHYGDVSRARKMIDAAKAAGADAIKFQHHLPDEEMLRDVPMSPNMSIPLYDFLKANALTIEQHLQLFEYAQRVGIMYLCTPFSWKAAQELEDTLSLPAYKIGSGEFTDTPTLERIATFGKPMILSTGMSTVKEIDFVYEFMGGLNVPFALMNCTSAYPASPSDVSLGFISRMRERYPAAWIGHSDHTPDIVTSIGAIALGARLVEKHVTVDSSLPGPDADVSITFPELADLVNAANSLHQARSSEKAVRDSEQIIRSWARRSLVYMRDLPAGSAIRADDIWGKRPGTGVPSYRLQDFLGRTVVRSVERNTLLAESDFAR